MTTMTMNPAAPTPSAARSIYAGLFLWLASVLAINAVGVLSMERMYLVPLGIFGSTLALIGLYRFSPGLRAFADHVDLRVPIFFHTVRAPIGVLFLVHAASGELDPVFAFRAGWGDILAGLLALMAALATPHVTPTRRAAALTFNVIGLLDIVLVIATAQWLLFFSGHPETIATMAQFPYGAIPLFVVPIVFATHLLIFVRIFRR